MADTAVAFDDASAYEGFMARWSRAIGTDFLDWLAPPSGSQWLEIGCGTGVFTKLLLERCSPSAVAAVDSAPAQIDLARTQLSQQQVDIRLCDAQSLPFADASFDIVASALVINFIPNRSRALAEMSRVCRPGGRVTGYVWDFAGERSAGWPLRLGFRRIGLDPPPIPGSEDTTEEALRRLFVSTGLEQVALRSIDVTMTFTSFDDYWRSQTPSFAPQGKMVAALTDRDRERLAEAVRAALPPPGLTGTITYTARAHAIEGRRS
jgi:SAM-dependent methyltransferase